MKRFSFLRTHGGPLLVLSILVGLLALTNFTPGTWLSGWDNLHPEFNFGLNIGRSLSSVWQEYQGVGLLGGMSHSADLPRQLILFVSSLLLSPQLLRYAWVWLTWWFGAVGAYLLATTLFPHNTSEKRPNISKVSSLITGIGYLLNLATIQYFYVPYESFSSFFGGLPWLLWAVIQYYQRPNSKRLAILFIVSLLASSAFYVQTLFVVFVLLMAVITACQLVVKKLSFKSAVLAGAVVLAANAFWLLPSAYFTLTSSQVTVQSKVNQLSTTESQLMNQSFGIPLNIALLKGYWFGYQDFQNGAYTYLIPQWRAHVDQGSVIAIGLAFWLLALVGVCLSMRRGNAWSLSWLACFLLVSLMLTSGNGPLGFIFSWASNHIPLFGQIFRTAFTKWSVAAGLIYAIGLGSFSYWMLSQLKKGQLVVTGSWLFVVASSLTWLVWPAFQGNLLSPFMRLQQPAAYHELFSFFEQQPKQSRVVALPIPDFWAWSFYSWNYRGSGFLWYGIEQPILDRNFDVWSAGNETFYNQLSTAFYGQDPAAFVATLQKYDVGFALIDESVVVPKKDAIPAQVKTLKTLLEQIGAKQVWSKDFLSVYRLPTGANQFVTAPKEYASVWQNNQFGRLDPAYQELGNYISGEEKPAVAYPLAQLSREELTTLTIKADSVQVEQQLPAFDKPATVVIPTIATGSAYPVYAKVTKQQQQLELSFGSAGTVSVGNKTLPISQLPNLDLPLEEPLTPTSYGTINLNGQTIELATGSAEASGWVTLKANSPISVSGEVVTGNYIERVNVDLPTEFWSNFNQPQTFSVDAGQHSLLVNLPTHWTPLPIIDLKSKNCDVFGRGTYSVDHFGLTVTSEATDYASICTGTTLPFLNTKISGLLRFTGENSAGRSLKFYVSNPNSQRADLEELLSSGSFDDIFGLLSWQNLPAQVYGLNWENRSFGQASVNQLNKIEVVPLNLERLVRLKIITDDFAPTQNGVKLNNNWKVGTYQYGTVANNSSERGLVTLAQGYDKGWVALAIPLRGSLNQLERLPHVNYNGWANGWLLPKGEFQVIILYWPQLIGFAGDVVVIAVGIFLVFKLFKKSK